MNELVLDDIRLKSVERMSDDEKAFLRENKEALTQEEVEAFAEFINEDEEPAGGEGGEGGGEGADDGEDGEGGEEGKAPVFKTQAEADAWLENKKKEWEDAEAKKKADEEAAKAAKAKEGEVPKYFPDGYKPKTWDEFAHTFIGVLKSSLTKDEEFARGVREALGNQTEAEKKRSEEINTEFDKELSEMAKEGLVPDPSTEEGKKVDAILTSIGAMMGLGTMRDAFKAAENLTKLTGVDVLKNGVPGGKKPDMTSQKKKAGMVGSGGSGGAAPEKKKDYKQMHSRTLEDIKSDALERLKEPA